MTTTETGLELAEQIVTCSDALAAIVAGDRTEQQIADRFGIDLEPIRDYRDPAESARHAAAEALSIVLIHLHCAGFLNMRVVDATWHYLPTKKAGGGRR